MENQQNEVKVDDEKDNNVNKKDTKEERVFKTPIYQRNAMKRYYEKKKNDPTFVAKNRERARLYKQSKRTQKTAEKDISK
jgi:hypothetical protein